MKKPKLPEIHKGIIPSQNAIRSVAHLLRSEQHSAMRSAINCEYVGQAEAAKSLRLQADDMRQIAQFLEDRIVKSNEMQNEL